MIPGSGPSCWASTARDPGGAAPAPIASGLVLVGVSFFLFLAPLSIAGDGHKAAMWIVAIYFVQTVGEPTPSGRSVGHDEDGPGEYASQMMGVWFLAVTAGDATTGLLSVAGVNLDRMGVVALEALLGVVAGAAAWSYRGKVKQLMGSVS